MTIDVSDHAVLRYMQRVQGFDVELVREHIRKVCGPNPNACSVRAEGVQFIIKNRTVITVRPKERVNPRRVPR